jgi:hypothetical protein
MLNFVYLRSSRLHFLHFGLIHALSTMAEVWACFGLLNAFRRFLGFFKPFLGSGVHRSDRSECWTCSHVAHRSDRWCRPVWPVRAELMQLLYFLQVVCMHWFRGSLHVFRGSSLWFFELWFGGLRSLLEHSFVSDVSSRCPCLRGPRLVFFKWSFSLPFFGFRSLVGVSLYLFLSSSFLSGYYMCGLSMYSSRGKLRTMCGSRIDGWSLPCVMSDWQRCVDWFLAKYCRWRLRLD